MVVVLAAFALTGCGAAQKKAAAPETDPWADYKGTFAGGVPTKEELKKAEEADGAKTGSTTKTAKNDDSKTFTKGSGKKIPEVKPADTRAPDVKPVPVSNDAKSMYNETGDNAAAVDASEEAPAPTKKGGKKTGKKAGGGGKKGAAKKGAAKK